MKRYSKECENTGIYIVWSMDCMTTVIKNVAEIAWYVCVTTEVKVVAVTTRSNCSSKKRSRNNKECLNQR